MWRSRPRLMLLGAVPAVVVGVVLMAGLITLAFFSRDLVVWGTPFLDDLDATLRNALRVAVQVALLGGYLFASWALFVALTLLLGEPFYARIHAETERMLGGVPQPDELGLVTAVGDGLRLLRRGALLAVAVFAVGTVPVVGTVIAAVGGAGVTAWLLADELLARPLEARGLDAKARARLLRRSRRSVLGFGLAVMLCFWVPFGAVVAMPAAVVGATRLARELLGEPVRLVDPTR